MCHPMTPLSPDLTINSVDMPCNESASVVPSLSGVGRVNENGTGEGVKYFSFTCERTELDNSLAYIRDLLQCNQCSEATLNSLKEVLIAERILSKVDDIRPIWEYNSNFVNIYTSYQQA